MDIGRIADLGSLTQQKMTKAAEHRNENRQTSLAADNTDKFLKAGSAFTPAYTKASMHKNNSDNNSTEKHFAEDKVERSKQFTKPDISELGEKSIRDFVLMTLLGESIFAHTVPRPPILNLGMPRLHTKSPEERFSELKEKFGGFEESEDHWTPIKCTERIIQFLYIVSGNDSTIAQTLKAEFHIGLNEAEAVYGGIGSLSEGCYATERMVLGTLDSWQKIDRKNNLYR